MNSIWKQNIQFPEFDALIGDVQADALVIGGGITGILCAYMLKKSGVECILVEADRICNGITKNTTAKITSQHGLIYSQIFKNYGLEYAKLYLQANEDALAEYQKMCKAMECDYTYKDSFVYSLDSEENIEAELKVLQKLGYSAEFEKRLPLPLAVRGAVKFRNQAQIHPLKFALELSKTIKIFENTKVKEIRDGYALTSRGRIKADKIIVATHFPFINKHGAYFLKMYQHRSYVIAIKNSDSVNGMYVDECSGGLSFRDYGQYLLIGGGSHRTGKKGGGWRELTEFAKFSYPKSQVVYQWATQDCMTLDGIPYIGKYYKGSSDLYVATGFNKWGMSSSMAAAKLLRDMVLNKDNPYESLFSPSRTVMHKQLFLNVAESLVGILTPTVPRCPHLGCALKYNYAEHSWDCPCHGSRFTKEKKLIDNPSTDDL